MADISIILEKTGLEREKLEKLIGDMIEDSVEIVIAEPGYLRVLNRRYRHIDRSTDVLTFDLALREEDMPEGTVYVDGRLFPPMEALLERIFHGYLHLKGYSHNTEKDAAGMKCSVDAMLESALRGRASN